MFINPQGRGDKALKTGFLCVAQVGLELETLLPHCLRGWDYRPVPLTIGLFGFAFVKGLM